jgi:cyclopropane-fatty-acyl-phospholipid synthase
MDPTKIAAALFDDVNRSFVVRLWDGTNLVPPRTHAAGSIVLRRAEALRLFVPPVDEDELADGFARGDIDVLGDTIDVLEATARWRGPQVSVASIAALASSWLARLGRSSTRRNSLDARLPGQRRSLVRDATAVRHHYDVSNEFYRLFLDSRMVYSCALFPSGQESLDEAQRLKLEWICRKLDLREGERLLDVGCGWGALLIHGARERRAECWGATVSREQFFAARKAAAEAGAPVRVFDCDYRRLPDESFDKIASVGMMEHVGGQNLDTYFCELARRLRPGGLLLNHAIADIARERPVMPWLRRRGPGFIQRCIFPDSELAPLPAVLAASERQGLEVRDVESLREHYAETLAHWLRNLERRFDDAIALVGAERARTWRLYLACSAVAFRLGRIGIYQALLAKRDTNGRVHSVPRWRGHWYAGSPARDSHRPAAFAPTRGLGA